MLRPTRLDYCQYLLSTPINYTLTHFPEHSESFSHDQINRYLAGDRLTRRMLWEHVKNDVVLDPDGYLIFDDTVIDKRYAKKLHSPNDNTRAMLAVSSTVLLLLRASMSMRS